MGDTRQYVGVAPGDGLVARVGDAMVVLPGAADTAFVDAVVALLEQAAVAGDAAGVGLAWQLAELVAGRRNDPAACLGLVAAVSDGWLVLLHGPVRAEITGPDRSEVLSGGQAVTWVDRVVRSPVERIAVSLAGAGPAVVDPRSDLRAGRVSGSGFAVATGPAAEPATAAPEPAAMAPAPHVQPATGSRPTVDVVGAPVATRPTATVPGVVGALRADDGTQITLDRAYVLGREPGDEESVRSGAASPVVVTDAENLVSRVQVFVSVEGGLVTVRDAGSANGTFVAPPGAATWTRIGPEPAELKPGWSVRVGKRVFVFVPSDGPVAAERPDQHR